MMKLCSTLQISILKIKNNKNLSVLDKFRKEKHETGIITIVAVRGEGEGKLGQWGGKIHQEK